MPGGVGGKACEGLPIPILLFILNSCVYRISLN